MSRLHFSVLLALRTFLNPIVFLAYLVFALGSRERGIVPAAGTNVSRLIPSYYAAFAVVVYAAWSGLSVLAGMGVSTLHLAAPRLMTAVFAGRLAWIPRAAALLEWPSFAATALVGYVWIDGMEGNIMGFFGFPILLLGAFCSVAAAVGAWLASLRP